jgi:predicted PurR-regulated permease PerM
VLRGLSPRTRNVLLGALAALGLYFAWTVRSVLNPLLAAYFLAFVLHPLVLRLQNYGWSRKRAVNTIFVIALGAFAVGSAALLVQAATYTQLVATPAWQERQVERLDGFLLRHQEEVAWTLDALGLPVEEGEAPTAAGLYADLRAELAPAPGEGEPAGEEGSPVMQLALRAFGSLLALVSFVVLLPIYTYFLLFELERIHAFVRRYLPRAEREHISRVGLQIGEVIGNFFRGRLAVCLAKGLFIAAGLALCGVQYALLLGMVAGAAALIPFAGPLLAYLMGLAFALQQGPGPSTPELDLFEALWRTGAVYLLAEGLEGYYLVPKILGESLGLHPVVVLVSIFAGGAAFGMFGILLALPVTASLVIVMREFVLPELARLADREAAEEA